jgi:hypothetical protein
VMSWELRSHFLCSSHSLGIAHVSSTSGILFGCLPSLNRRRRSPLGSPQVAPSSIGISGRLALELVAAFHRNQSPFCRGICNTSLRERTSRAPESYGLHCILTNAETREGGVAKGVFRRMGRAWYVG